MGRSRRAERLGSRGPRRRSPRILSLIGAIVLVVGAMAESGLADPASPSLVEVGKAFGFDADQVDEIRGGETVVSELEANSDNELALSVGFLSVREADWLLARVERNVSSDPTILSSGDFGADPAASLKALVLPDDELDRLVDIEPGGDANFSADEIKRLRAAGRSSSDRKVRRVAQLSTLREILVERLAAYQQTGLAGITPYDRGDGETSSPAAQLERAFSALAMTKRLVPAVQEAMARFPAAPADGVISRFRWIVHEAQGRPVVALAHVVAGRAGGRLAAIERRFFVSHTLNSLQVVVLSLPHEKQSLLFYANRTGTDQVTGFGSTVAKGVGRKIMKGELERLADAFIAAAAKD